jgi:hypothetical protein
VTDAEQAPPSPAERGCCRAWKSGDACRRNLRLRANRRKLVALRDPLPRARPQLPFYLAGARPGAVAYNAMHTTIGPIALAGAGIVAAQPVELAIALIWAAHIGFDRMLGYGLKNAAGFGFTHLGRLGRDGSTEGP